jgi:hypothetical protein
MVVRAVRKGPYSPDQATADQFVHHRSFTCTAENYFPAAVM